MSKKKSIKLLLICVVVFFIGYYLLNHISTLEDPPVGPIFHIILGCILMAISVLFAFLLLNKMFIKKKRRARSGQTFLKDEKNN